MTDTILLTDDTNFKTNVLSADGTVVVDFWAPWCAPCRMQGPILERFAAARPDVRVVKVNVDESPVTAQSYGIRSIPTIAVFRDGAPIIGAAGVQNEKALTKLVATQ